MSRIRNFFHRILFTLAMIPVLFVVMFEWAGRQLGRLRRRGSSGGGDER